MRLKDINLSDHINTTVKITGIILANTLSSTSAGDPMLNITLGDSRIKENMKCFWNDYKKFVDNKEDIPEVLQAGNLVELTCSVSLYNGNPSLIIKYFSKSNDTIDNYKEIFPQYDKFIAFYHQLINEVKNPDLKAILSYETEKYFEIFSKIPAAKAIHHTEVGGVLCHSVSIALNARPLCKNYNFIYGEDFVDSDVVITAALFHDFMKVKEYTFDEYSGACDMSDEAAISSHIMMMLEELFIAQITLKLLDSEAVKKVKHCIASHHGKLEHGSPVTPACPEAVMLSQLDVLDMKMWQMDSLRLSMPSNKQSNSKFIGGERMSYYEF